MEDQETIFISDQLFLDSTRATKLQRILAFLTGIVLIIAGIIGFNRHKADGTIIIPIIQLFSGIVLATFDFTQRMFYKKVGKLYISFHEDQIEIRNKYFKPPVQIKYADIDHIKFQLSKIFIFLKSQKVAAIKLSLPFSKVEEVRQKFRNELKDKNISIEDK